MEHALRVLAEMKGTGRAIAVLGDMLELGDSSLSSHQQLGALLAGLCLEKIFLMGTFAEAVAESARAKGMKEETLSIGETHAQIAQKLHEVVQDGDWILFKGSRGMRMERIVERVLSLRQETSHTFSLTNTTTAKCNC
jgi:UDP-N-acetylmuramoyl-tripeptide--D-alanyl-D-alanine ligase